MTYLPWPHSTNRIFCFESHKVAKVSRTVRYKWVSTVTVTDLFAKNFAYIHEHYHCIVVYWYICCRQGLMLKCFYWRNYPQFHSKLSFCVMNLYYRSNYWRMVVNFITLVHGYKLNYLVMYIRNLTIENVGTVVNYCGIFVTSAPGNHRYLWMSCWSVKSGDFLIPFERLSYNYLIN